ncbi:unnamed protein product [Anisakis simplex]|uniref:Stress-activated protein kinase JNK n=1 Tax=Anisakis simplex TaxID=6269 RepID=A0A0M3K0R0_ANISI|nr:unnamed protein product [Anisakis simplex]
MAMLIAPHDDGVQTFPNGCSDPFVMPKRYTFNGVIANGALGFVCEPLVFEPYNCSSATDKVKNRTVAIKKFHYPFHNEFAARRVYREIKLLKCIKHENIITLLDVFSPQHSSDTLRDVYIVTELMDADLSKVVKLDVDNTCISYMVYQICCAINYLHSLGIIHRDLKPSNIGVNGNCKVKILGFGLARTKDGRFMSPYVTTRYYRAPEVLLGMQYDAKGSNLLSNLKDFSVDVWSIGCILAELILGVPLFCGVNTVDQWHKILIICGSPNQNFTDKMSAEAKYVTQLMPTQTGISFDRLFTESLLASRNFETAQVEQHVTTEKGVSALSGS